jgi:hypothetical protein
MQRPTAPAPPPQQDSFPGGTMKSIRSMTDSYTSGDYNNLVSSFTDQSTPSSQPGTLNKQIISEYATFKHYTQVNTQTNQVRQYSIIPGQPIPLEESPQIEYADQNDTQSFVVKSGELPKVNHCVLIRNSIHSSEWDSQVSF